MPIGVYVHIPFCERKCNYCSFLSSAQFSRETLSEYTKYLLREVSLIKQKGICGEHPCERPVDSIFIGGGTPSLLDEYDIGSLLGGLRKHFDLKKDTEITIETNPNSLNRSKLKAYLDAGVNRISIGLQSFDDEILARLGRLHTAEEGMAAVESARNAGFTNINLDLMFGIPGQSLDIWMKSLEEAVKLDPSHLSLYSLQIEEGTQLYNDYKLERIDSVDLTVDRQCYHDGIGYLSRNGFAQYEISNFSKMDFQCKHNMKYWNMEDFLGLGVGASSYLGGKRWKNITTRDGWFEQIEKNEVPKDVDSIENETLKSSMGIFMFTGLRKIKGISLTEFKERFHLSFFDAFKDNMPELMDCRKRGLLDWDAEGLGRVWLTENGIDVSNNIFECFV